MGAKPWVLNTGCQTLGAKHWVLNYVCNTLGAKLMWVLMIWVLYNGGKQGVQLSLGAKQCVQYNGRKTMGANVIWV